MKQALSDQMVCESIDVAIIGCKSFELLELLLQRDLNLVPMPKLKDEYHEKLWSLYPQQPDPSGQLPSKYPAMQPEQTIQKYCTNILTESFWLQFNFFYFGSCSYDPLLADITRGHISTCILVNDEEDKYNLDTKRLVGADEQQGTPRSGRSASSRDELVMEHRILNSLHNLKLSQFSSVLTLKMTDRSRIIESSSNIKLCRNQVLRWIVDRHFENQFGIKLKGELGDEIENYQPAPARASCAIM